MFLTEPGGHFSVDMHLPCLSTVPGLHTHFLFVELKNLPGVHFGLIGFTHLFPLSSNPVLHTHLFVVLLNDIPGGHCFIYNRHT